MCTFRGPIKIEKYKSQKLVEDSTPKMGRYWSLTGVNNVGGFFNILTKVKEEMVFLSDKYTTEWK